MHGEQNAGHYVFEDQPFIIPAACHHFANIKTLQIYYQTQNVLVVKNLQLVLCFVGHSIY